MMANSFIAIGIASSIKAVSWHKAFQADLEIGLVYKLWKSKRGS
jgi:hypothetical protein